MSSGSLPKGSGRMELKVEACSPSMGIPLLQQISLGANDVLPELGKLPFVLLTGFHLVSLVL